MIRNRRQGTQASKSTRHQRQHRIVRAMQSPVSSEDERLMLELKIHQLTAEWNLGCRRRRLVKLLDSALRSGDRNRIDRCALRICALDAEFCFGMWEKKYLKSRRKSLDRNSTLAL